MQLSSCKSSNCVQDIEDNDDYELIPSCLVIFSLVHSDFIKEIEFRVKKSAREHNKGNSKHSPDGKDHGPGLRHINLELLPKLSNRHSSFLVSVFEESVPFLIIRPSVLEISVVIEKFIFISDRKHDRAKYEDSSRKEEENH